VWQNFELESVLSGSGRARKSFEHEFAIDCRLVEFEKWGKQDVVLSRSSRSLFYFLSDCSDHTEIAQESESQRSLNFVCCDRSDHMETSLYDGVVVVVVVVFDVTTLFAQFLPVRIMMHLWSENGHCNKQKC